MATALVYSSSHTLMSNSPHNKPPLRHNARSASSSPTRAAASFSPVDLRHPSRHSAMPPPTPPSTPSQGNATAAPARKRQLSGDNNGFDLKRVKMEKPTSTSDNNNGEGKIPTTLPPGPLPQYTQNSPIAKVAKRQQTLSEYVLACLANYGLCVLDNFMGTIKASQILDDVLEMDESGILKSGKTVQKEDEVKNVRKVDQDRIAFIQKNRSEGIDDLVYKLDNLVTNVQMKSRVDPAYANRKFIDVSGRTRAMVSCYPGNGTHYTRHVDNRHKDGRCVTVVYYLNKDWNVKTHGGMLKVYPQQTAPRVANIVPVFDRALIFWSDERNPHEVMPAFRSRYAVTVWYFDREERQKALERQQTLSGSGSGSSLSSTASAPDRTEPSSSPTTASTPTTTTSISRSTSGTMMH